MTLGGDEHETIFCKALLGTGAASMSSADHLVLIVDDDDRVRESLAELLAADQLSSAAFGSAAEYIGYPKPDVPSCLILDVELSDVNGLELQRQLNDGHHPPIIFVTGHGSIPSSVRAATRGACARETGIPQPLALP